MTRCSCLMKRISSSSTNSGKSPDYPREARVPMTATIPDSFEESKYKKVTDLNPEEEVAPGSALCAGCGAWRGFVSP